MRDITDVLLVLLVILILCTFAMVPVSIYASNVCSRLGYPTAYIVIPFEVKCGRVIQQTEYICSIDEIQSERCGK